jgi:pimeloyl-ACP methyl ester carboxylesterase
MDKELWSMLRQRIIESYREYRSAEEYYELLRANQPLMMPKTAYRLAESSLLPTPDGKLRPKFDIAVVEKDFDNRREWLPDFSGCPLPVLILRGAGSAFLSKSQAEKLTARLPRGTLITVELAGHAIMSDNPKGFQKALIPFLFKIRSAHDV